MPMRYSTAAFGGQARFSTSSWCRAAITASDSGKSLPSCRTEVNEEKICCVDVRACAKPRLSGIRPPLTPQCKGALTPSTVPAKFEAAIGVAGNFEGVFPRSDQSRWAVL